MKQTQQDKRTRELIEETLEELKENYNKDIERGKNYETDQINKIAEYKEKKLKQAEEEIEEIVLGKLEKLDNYQE